MKQNGMLLFIFMLYISIAIVGSTYKPAQKNGQSEARLYVTPSSLFEGDAKKLEPHFGVTSGAVKIRYEGPPTELISHYEILEKGKKTQKGGGVGTSISTTPYDGEFSVVLRKVDDQKNGYSMTMAFTDKTGYAQAETSFQQPVDLGKSNGVSSATLRLHDSKNVTPGSELSVWGIVMQEGNVSFVDSIEQSIQKADWALVIKLSVANN